MMFVINEILFLKYNAINISNIVIFKENPKDQKYILFAIFFGENEDSQQSIIYLL